MRAFEDFSRKFCQSIRGSAIAEWRITHQSGNGGWGGAGLPGNAGTGAEGRGRWVWDKNGLALAEAVWGAWLAELAGGVVSDGAGGDGAGGRRTLEAIARSAPARM